MKLLGRLSAMMPLWLAFSCSSNPVPPPTGLTAEPSMTSMVTLRWDSVPGAESYRVYRLAWGIPWAIDSQVIQPYFQDSQLADDTDYEYRISALVGGREGQLSAPVVVRTHPGQIRGLTASLGTQGVTVQWEPFPGVLAYRISRETEAGELPPASFEVKGDQPPSRFLDPTPPPGLTSYYFVMPILENVAYSYGGSPFVAVTVPGLKAVREASHFPPSEAPLVVTAEEQKGAVQLAWTDLGRAVTYRVFRQSGIEAAQVIDEGLLSHRFWDASPPMGVPVTYSVEALTGTQALRRSGPVTVTTKSGPTLPGTADLLLRLPGQPVQLARLVVADLGQPVRGVLVLVGQDPEAVPHLVAAAGAARVAVLALGTFNFGTEASPRTLTTKIDRGHPILILDLRRPALGSAYLAKALDEASRVWPNHPELTQVPLAGWAFSQADVGLNQILARPEWAHRVAAVIHGNALEVDYTIPLSRLAGVPHLMLLSGRQDLYSQLLAGLAYTPQVTREAFLHNLITRQGLPITIVNNEGQGHGGGLDTPYAADWLAAVFAQRGGTTPGSWQDRVGWTAGFKVDSVTQTPWGDGKNPGVKLSQVSIQQGHPDTPLESWFPSKTSAEHWLAQTFTSP